jgi:hypothetical protein
MNRKIVNLADHPRNLDRTAKLVSSTSLSSSGRDIYRVTGGFLACVGHSKAFLELFPTFEAAEAAIYNRAA